MQHRLTAESCQVAEANPKGKNNLCKFYLFKILGNANYVMRESGSAVACSGGTGTVGARGVITKRHMGTFGGGGMLS